MRANGQIEVGSGTELDYETKTTYMVTLTAEDSFGSSSSIMVTIEVNPIDEVPEIVVGGLAISGPSSPDYPENGTGAVENYTASGPNAASATWTLGGDDAGDFSISSNGVLSFRSSPNFEMAADADTDNTYMVSVKADDGTYMNTHDVTVMVTNVDEDGTVTLSPTAPRVGTELMASLTDPDDVTAGSVTWHWASSDAMNGTYTNIPGATSDSYEPVASDEGKYLRATASYTDGYGADTAYGTSANAVVDTAAPTTGSVVGDKYDTSKNGEIEGPEAIQAVKDYFAGDISGADVIAVVKLYFASR